MMKKINILCFALLTFITANSQTPINTQLQGISRIRQSNCDSALMLLQEVDQSIIRTDADRASIHLEYGLTHYCLGNFELALKEYQKSLDLFENTADVPQQANLLNLIGTLHKKQGNMGEALEYFKKGFVHSQKHQDSLGMGNSTNNIGLVYFQTNQVDRALEYFLKSTEIKTLIKDTVGLSYNYDNLAMTYSQLGDFDKSLQFFELAGEYKLLTGDKVGYAIVRNNLGEMVLARGDADEAIGYFDEALKVAKQTDFKDFEQHVLSMLSEAYAKKGDMMTAFSFYKSHIALKDSLFNDRKIKQIAELEARYQTEKKERQIEIQHVQLAKQNVLLAGSGALIVLLLTIGFLGHSRLKWKNRQLLEEQKRLAREAEMNAVISSQEKERNRFARDLHDGFGQLISTLNLNLKNLGSPKNKDEREKMFNASAAVLEEMYQELKNICFDLMPQTLIKHGLEAALNEFANRINLAEKQHVEVNVFGLNERLTDLQEISLYRISQEWVNNILKYSDAKKIVIQITKDEAEITLLIEDDGTGFDKVKLRAGNGNGWRNMTSRSNLIHGELELDTQPGVKGNTLIMNATLAPRQVGELVLV